MSGVILPTARAYIESDKGIRSTIRILLDQGSQASFITEGTAQLLSADRKRVHIPLSDIGSVASGVVRSVSTVTLYSFYDSKFKMSCDVLIYPKLTGLLPATDLSHTLAFHRAGLHLADPHYYKPAKVDALLGAGAYNALIREGLHRIHDTGLIAQETALGWVVSGYSCDSRSRRAEVSDEESVVAMFCSAEEELRQSLRLWLLEDPERPRSLLSPDEERYTVRLLFARTPPSVANETRQVAQRSLIALLKRLSREPKLSRKYHEFMNEYLELRHMERVPPDELNNPRA
ncbi:uncharacterized protein [Cardiocondyla obscurior]|uniref:uncharacterized protein n=1 Tax=Cardiocondyla obscurior TaxID=286306 RepID=UPI0039658708